MGNTDTNPHFLPRRNGDPKIELFPQTPPSPAPPRIRHQPRPRKEHASVDPTRPEATRTPKPQPVIPEPTFKPPGPVVLPGREPHSGQGQGQDHDHSSLLQAPKYRRTRPAAWLVAAFCAVFWIVVIVGGLIVLTFYLVFKPRDPRFDLSSATFNAAYLDMGYFLNADVTLLINFTNPNTKANVDFTFIAVDLYYQNDFVATRYVRPFSVTRMESMFASVNVVASEVRLGAGVATELRRQIGYGRITFEIRAVIKTRSRFGALFRYSYWLYPYCKIELTSPPTGVLVRKRCVTKR